jgi:DNA polymerase
MSPDFGALLQYTDADLASLLDSKLFQSDRSRKAGRPAANDDDVIFHAFAFDRLCHLQVPVVSPSARYEAGAIARSTDGLARIAASAYHGMVMATLTKSEALAALAWLIDAGADEAIGEGPFDRLGAAPPAPEPRSVIAPTPTGRQNAPNPVPMAQPRRPDAMLQGKSEDVGAAMELAARCNTLEELRAALDGFHGLELRKLATRTVFSDGNPSSRIMFVGEAPGREEDRMGLPFVGRAGKLLDAMLKSIGLDRGSAYITNVLPWRPPENRNPEATEVAQCIPFLRRHIELVAPGIMILLGAVAVRHVLGLNEGIMKYRGRWLEYRIGDAMVPVMPTLHPAYLLRQPAHKKLAWRDLQEIRSRIEALNLVPLV